MNIYLNPDTDLQKELVKRPEISPVSMNELLNEVFEAVKQNGDKALVQYTEKFDKVKLDSLVVSSDESIRAMDILDRELRSAIQTAAKNIKRFHSAQRQAKEVIETQYGVKCWTETRPIEKVGIYIPGGSAPLFSTVLMLGIPALIAGCKEIVLCTPPDENGEINPAILYTAQLIGINQIFKVGGIQAIAGMTYGTESIPQVYKIFGPGNQYVTAAKQFAQQLGVAIDMPAGPSELLVTADDTSIPEFVASDLLSQAEHGTDSQVVCLVSSKEMAERIQKVVYQQVKELPRQEIAEKALENSQIVFLSKQRDRINFINAYAPEHLIIAEDNPEIMIPDIMNAGSVFIGNYTPESAGDYASGTNHTLPTNGFARSYSGVNLDAFIKKITFQKISPSGLSAIGPTIIEMAEAEGLRAHSRAVSIRLKQQA